MDTYLSWCMRALEAFDSAFERDLDKWLLQQMLTMTGRQAIWSEIRKISGTYQLTSIFGIMQNLQAQSAV